MNKQVIIKGILIAGILFFTVLLVLPIFREDSARSNISFERIACVRAVCVENLINQCEEFDSRIAHVYFSTSALDRRAVRINVVLTDRSCEY